MNVRFDAYVKLIHRLQIFMLSKNNFSEIFDSGRFDQFEWCYEESHALSNVPPRSIEDMG
jgi:hypothetical protein